MVRFKMRFFYAMMALLWVNISWSLSPREVLSRSAEFHQKLDVVQIQFTQYSENTLTGDKGQLEGDLILGKQDAFILKTPGLELYSDGISMWDYRPQSSQVLIKSLLDIDNAFHPSQILFKYLECEPISAEKIKLGSKEVWKLSLDPKNKIRGLESLIVWIDMKNASPIQIETVDIGSNKARYLIRKISNVKKESVGFEFLAPNGVEVLDMR
jgi:outer membrane lipoprotein-sorting protein